MNFILDVAELLDPHLIFKLLQCQNLVGFHKQILDYIYVCIFPSEVSLQLKTLPKNIYKNKCRGGEMNTIFNSQCLFPLNALIQFKQSMLFCFECFNTVQIAHACLQKIYEYRRKYLHFAYNDIYICSMHFSHLISIIKCHHHFP